MYTNVQLFFYDVRSPFVAEVDAAPLKRFGPSGVKRGENIALYTSVNRGHSLGRCGACGHPEYQVDNHG